MKNRKPIHPRKLRRIVSEAIARHRRRLAEGWREVTGDDVPRQGEEGQDSGTLRPERVTVLAA